MPSPHARTKRSSHPILLWGGSFLLGMALAAGFLLWVARPEILGAGSDPARTPLPGAAEGALGDEGKESFEVAMDLLRQDPGFLNSPEELNQYFQETTLPNILEASRFEESALGLRELPIDRVSSVTPETENETQEAKSSGTRGG